MSSQAQTLLFILRVQDQASQALQGAGLAFASLGFAVGAATVAAVRAQVEFSRTFTQMQTLAGVTAQQVAGLSEAVRTMAVNTGQGPQDLANALYFISSSGFEAQEALGVLEASARGAAIGLGTTATVADAVTSAMNAYGHANLSAADATGIMTQAVRMGKVEADQLAAALGNVIPIAAQTGVSFRDINAAVAAMSLSGLTASEAVTAVRQTLLAISAPTQQARRVLHSLGLDYRELQRVFREQGYLAGIERMRQVLGTDVNMRMVLGDVQAVNGNASLLNQNLERTTQIFREVGRAGSQTLREAFEIASRSDAFSWAQGMALLKVALLDIGQAVMPIVRAAIMGLVQTYMFLKSAVETVSAFLSRHHAVIMLVVTAIGAWLVIRTLPTVLLALGSAIQVATIRLIAMTAAMQASTGAGVAASISAIGTAFVLLGQAIGAAAIALGRFALALLTTPVGWLIAGITAVVGTIAYLTSSSDDATAAWYNQVNAMGVTKERYDAMYAAAARTVEQNQALRNASLHAGDGMNMSAQQANNFTQALQRLGLTAAWAEFQVARLALTRTRDALVRFQQSERPGGVAGFIHDAQGRVLVQQAPVVIQMAQDASTNLRMQLNNRLHPQTQPPRSNVADYTTPRHQRQNSGMSDEERQAQQIHRVVEALQVEAQSIGQTAEQHDYLDNIRRAGLNTMQLEQQTLQQGLAITDQQAAADQRLNGIREIARAVEARRTAEMRERMRDMNLESMKLRDLTDTLLLSARRRAGENAVIEAQNRAAQDHIRLTEREIAVIRRRALAEFDANAVRDNVNASFDYADQMRMLVAQRDAFNMTARARAIYLAGERERIRLEREGAVNIEQRVQDTQRLAAAQYDLEHRTRTVTQATQQFMDELRDHTMSYGDLVYGSLNAVMDGLNGIMDRFFSGQKIGWASTAASVAGAIAKMIAQMLLMKAVMASMKFLGLGFSDGAPFGGPGGEVIGMAKGGAFAQGGAFTNSIVDALTAFVYHEDGKKKMGVMGEAGPEVIMPLIKQGNAMAVAAWAQDGTRRALALTRGPDGSLGVKLPDRAHPFAKGGEFGGTRGIHRLGPAGFPAGNVMVQEGDTHISVPVSISYTPTGDATMDQRNIRMLRKVVEGAVDERIGVAIRRISKKGGQMNQFGMKQ